jgi:hypothetical protein
MKNKIELFMRNLMNLASCAIADLAGGFGYRNLPSRNPDHWQNSRDFLLPTKPPASYAPGIELALLNR